MASPTAGRSDAALDLLIVHGQVPEGSVPPYGFGQVEGVAAKLASTTEAADVAHTEQFDVLLILPDVPRIEQQELCRRLRQAGLTVPILALLAWSTAKERVAVLDAGADDCISSTTDPRELVARLFAASRRRRRPNQHAPGEPEARSHDDPARVFAR